MDYLKIISELNVKAKGKTPQEILKLSFDTFGKRITFASSLGEEDQVITDMISRNTPQLSIFTLDTGRLFQESYNLLAQTQKKYSNLEFKIYYPNNINLEDMVKQKGINLFYESVENRKFCCHVRKVEPLQRALSNVDAWITGLRRSQSSTRTDLELVEWDESNKKIKINPLLNWALQDVHKYIAEYKVDINPLHKAGFVSIGCAPCTRAIKEGEDIRSGRWWWENPEQKECGLHNNPKRHKK